MINIRTVKVLVLYYTILSFTEWFLHKNLMHKGSDNLLAKKIQDIHVMIYKYSASDKHEDHHKNVENNGVVHDQEGLYFLKMDVIFLILIVYILYISLSKLLINGLSKRHYIIMVIIVTLTIISYYLIWNILHPRYHRFNDSYNENGIIENNCIYKYLEKYHMLHHFNKGEEKCNFNIILPGADFIMGTYKGCLDNSKLCNSNNKLTKKEIELCAKQKVGEKIPYGITYCSSSSSSVSPSHSSSYSLSSDV